jgi:hypothetical protein
VKLSAEKLVECLPASLPDAIKHLAGFETACPISFASPGYVRRAILEGETTVNVLAVDGTPAFLLGWRITADGGLWVDLCQSLHTGHDFAHVIKGAEMIARNHAARYIRFATHRAGLARRCQSFGYVPESLVLTKGL